MGVLNKRNAVLGWAVWQVGKRQMKSKVKAGVSADTARSKKGIAAAAAALGGALLFWRRRRAGDESD